MEQIEKEKLIDFKIEEMRVAGFFGDIYHVSPPKEAIVRNLFEDFALKLTGAEPVLETTVEPAPQPIPSPVVDSEFAPPAPPPTLPPDFHQSPPSEPSPVTPTETEEGQAALADGLQNEPELPPNAKPEPGAPTSPHDPAAAPEIYPAHPDPTEVQ